MIRAALILGLAALLFFFFRWLSRQSPRVYWQSIGTLIAVGLLVMVATGRAHWLAAVVAVLLPFMRAILVVLSSLPVLNRVLAGMKTSNSSNQSDKPDQGQTSSVQSKFIQMNLNHDTGDINGEVLQGQFTGRTLDQLQLEDLLELLHECQDDEESVALLQVYLERMYADTWQQQAGAHQQQQRSSTQGKMSREEALQILGLSANPSDAEIIHAHRRLMKNLHPDHGGSTYLAAKINLAKETLLAK